MPALILHGTADRILPAEGTARPSTRRCRRPTTSRSRAPRTVCCGPTPRRSTPPSSPSWRSDPAPLTRPGWRRNSPAPPRPGFPHGNRTSSGEQTPPCSSASSPSGT
ncbi:hypothetical protein O1L60_34475 [Streptomyces diastatochromogenes]|nr:hypothetical protein [Streptomyces diastatochromogenes]